MDLQHSRPKTGSGILKRMETAMENADFGERSDLSSKTFGSNSDGSATNSTPNLGQDLDKDDGVRAERKLSFLDALLSQLQSQLSELSQSGQKVRTFRRSDGLAFLLEGVSLCPKCNIIHTGTSCPHC